jgi:hypothetical protein
MTAETIFMVLGSGLKLWASAESRKYIDKFFKLKKEYYEEKNKPEHLQDYAVMDRIEFELNLLCVGFNSSVGEPQSKNMP